MESKNMLRIMGLMLIALPIFTTFLRMFFPLDPETQRQMQEFHPNEIMPLWKSISIDAISLFGGIWILRKINRFDKETESFSKEMKYLMSQQIASTLMLGGIVVFWILSIGNDFPIRGYFFLGGLTLIMIGWFLFVRQRIKVQQYKEFQNKSDEE